MVFQVEDEFSVGIPCVFSFLIVFPNYICSLSPVLIPLFEEIKGGGPLPLSIIETRTLSEDREVLRKGSGKCPLGWLNRGNNEEPQDLEITCLVTKISFHCRCKKLRKLFCFKARSL